MGSWAACHGLYPATAGSVGTRHPVCVHHVTTYNVCCLVLSVITTTTNSQVIYLACMSMHFEADGLAWTSVGFFFAWSRSAVCVSRNGNECTRCHALLDKVSSTLRDRGQCLSVTDYFDSDH